MIQQMHVKSPLLVGVLAASVGLGFLVGVMVLPGFIAVTATTAPIWAFSRWA